MIGKTLAHYRIIEKIGSGGMGEVYRATDTRLGRDVALKILPADLARKRERRLRFEREAQTISSLSHPGICILHDVGHDDGTSFLVMELLEGETLAERLRRGPVSIDDALRWGAEIADALACAHRRGIVHRDLKPGNVMLTPTGLKLLDFGLAKETGVHSGPGGLAEVLTATASQAPLTGEGTILGTVPYMAPEQVQGRSVDARTDLFALGAVLYEMLTGERAFADDSRIGLVAAVLEREPVPLATVAPHVPPALERTVRACLSKSPDERWQSAQDVARELRWIAEDRANPAPAVHPPGKWRERTAWTVAVLALVVAAVLASRRSPDGGAPEQPTTRFTFEDRSWRGWTPTVSPDGRKILYRAFVGTGTAFRIRSLDSLVPRDLPMEGPSQRAFWSPDSRHVAFSTGGDLMRVPVDGGLPERICAAGGTADGDWHASGTILLDVGPGGQAGIWKVDASGGEAVCVFPPDSTGASYTFPSFLPDGRHCVMVESAGGQGPEAERRLVCGDLVTGQISELGPVHSQAKYAEPGYLLYARSGKLVARPFDADRIRFTGEPRPLAEIPAMDGLAPFSVSPSGVLVYESPRVATGRLLWLDRAGRLLGDIETPGIVFEAPRLSPDGRFVAVVLSRSYSEDLWTHDLARGTFSRLTTTSRQVLQPLWSRDGRWIDYTRMGDDGWQTVRAVAAGGEVRDTLSTSENFFWLRPSGWSNDGRLLVVDTRSRTTSDDIVLLDGTDGGAPRPFIATRFRENASVLSPDGRWLAYVSDESGRAEVYVVPFPEGEGRWQLSHSGGRAPRWRGDGRELVYSTEFHLVAVDVDASDGFEASAPRNLFQLPGTVRPGNFDLTSDGERTLWSGASDDDDLRTFEVVLNWATELE